jgi:hypothetical protein
MCDFRVIPAMFGEAVICEYHYTKVQAKYIYAAVPTIYPHHVHHRMQHICCLLLKNPPVASMGRPQGKALAY